MTEHAPDAARVQTERLARELTRRRITLSLAESCTGGLIAKRLTDAPGASAYLLAGITAYADEAKQELLDVQAETLAAHGAVSEAVAREMAHGAQHRTRAGAAIAVTGIAGPGGGTEAKPVGTVWLAAALGPELRTRHHRFDGDRAAIRDQAAHAALDLLLELLERTGKADPLTAS